MNAKSFKINEVNTMTRLLLTKSEAIGLCKKGNHKARKIFIKRIIDSLLTIPEVGDVVGDDLLKINQIPDTISLNMTAEIVGSQDHDK